jgi:hypothetical protein
MFIFYPGFNPQNDSDLLEKGRKDIAVVNTVNCGGTSKNSRGIAGRVFQEFDGVHKAYMEACGPNAEQRLFPGAVQPLEVNGVTGEREKNSGFWVFNAATKDHYRDPSKIEWVDRALGKVADFAVRFDIKTLSIPPLGCGEGKLDWDKQVGPLLLKHLGPLEEKGVTMHVFASDPDPSRKYERSVPPSKNRKGMPQFYPEGTRPVVVRKESDEKWYAGIGARPESPEFPTGTPPFIEKKMVEVGKILAEKGWGLRSGAAKGADAAFEKGAVSVPGHKKEIYLPNNGFQRRYDNGTDVIGPKDDEYKEKSIEIARRIHKYGKNLKGFALEAMSRNAFQVMGPKLDTPSNVIVCYTQKGAAIGGTGQSIKLAAEQEIPVVNMGDPRLLKRSAKDIVSVVESAYQGRSVDEAIEALPDEKKKKRDMER